MKVERILNYLAKAEDFLLDAEVNFPLQRYMLCVNRIYYTMFTCVQALFFKDDIIVKSHKGTIAKFGEVYIRTNLIERRFNEMLGKVFESKQYADYELDR